MLNVGIFGGFIEQSWAKMLFCITNVNALKCYNLRFIFLSDIAYYQDINFTLNYCNYRIIYNKKNILYCNFFLLKRIYGDYQTQYSRRKKTPSFIKNGKYYFSS